MDEVERVARGLTEKQVRVFAALGEGARDWFAAADLCLSFPASVGATLNSLMCRSLLERRGDPAVWGRAQYRLTPLGLQVKAWLEENSHG